MTATKAFYVWLLEITPPLDVELVASLGLKRCTEKLLCSDLPSFNTSLHSCHSLLIHPLTSFALQINRNIFVPNGQHPRINFFTTVNESNLLNWRQLSQRPEGSPNHWKDDIRARADHGTPRISLDHHIHIDCIQPTRNNDDMMTMMRGEDGMERAKERTKDAADTLLELAKKGTAKAIESGLELGEIAKRTWMLRGMLLRTLPTTSKTP